MTESIILRDAPDIPDLAFRHYAEESDFEALVAVIKACQEHDKVDPLSTEAGIPSVEEVTRSFSEAEHIDLYADMLLVCMAGEVIGFQWVRWWEQADGISVYYHRGRVVPAWRQHGIGTATMHWAEGRIQELVDQHNTRGKAVIRANTTMYEGPYNEVLLKEGYVPVHSFVEMGLDYDDQALPEIALPPDFELKPATVAHFRAIWEAKEEAFAEEWGHRRVTDEDYIVFVGDVLDSPGSDPALWQIAWAGDEIAGVALCRINERGVAEIDELSVRAQWRGQGLGRALLYSALHALKARDMDHVRIFTDSNQARTLYETAGFRILTEYIRYQKPLD